MRRPLVWALALLVTSAACSDQLTTPTTPPYILDPSRTIDPQGSLDEEIQLLTETLFPRGLETAAGTRWDNVKAKYAAGLADPSQMRVARQMLFELGRWVSSMTGKMEPPPFGETRESAAARLVGYMALYVYQGPGTDVPPFNPEADAVVGFVTPTAAVTVVTPLKLAGIGFDAGSVTEPMVVTIVQNPQQFPLNCTGPLTTPRCQYPLFYEFDFYPAQRLLKPAHGSVCHVLEGRPRRPLDAAADETEPVHTRMALAHTLPSDTANYTPGATQYFTAGSAPGAPPIENIEVLPPSTQAVRTSGTTCATDPYYTFEERSDFLGRLALAVEKIVRPTPLFAVDQGPEWDFVFASPFNYVDVAGVPDLSIEAAAASLIPVIEGPAQARVRYTVHNRSPVEGGIATATSPAGTMEVFLSDDAVVGEDDALVASAGIPSLVPDSSIADSLTFTLPPFEGARYLILRGSTSGILGDGSAGNNTVVLPISDGPVLSARVCPGESGAYQTVLAAHDDIADGGQITLCDGTHAVSGVHLGSKTVRISAEHAGQATVDAAGAAVSFRITANQQTSADTVTLSGLTFRNATQNNVEISQQYGVVIVEQNEFHPGSDAPYGELGYDGGIAVFAATGSGVVIQGNRFVGGDIGVHVVNSDRFTIAANNFDRQNNAAVHIGSGDGSTYASTGVVARNTVTGCGARWCVGLFHADTVLVANNTITVDLTRPTASAIHAGAARAVVIENVITGEGAGSDRSDWLSYPIQDAAIGTHQALSVHVQGNRITNAWSVFWLSDSHMTASDNIATRLYTVGGGWGTASFNTLRFNRNDVSDYVLAFGVSMHGWDFEPSYSFSVADLRCNYWGTGEGPGGFGGNFTASAFTPWSEIPIAGTANTCTVIE